MKIITRDSWGAKPQKSRFSKLGEAKGLVVHWSAYPKAPRRINTIQLDAKWL